MLISRLILVFGLSLAASASALAQTASTCLPRDSAAVKAWHAKWDGMSFERLQNFSQAQSGLISLEEPGRRVRVDRANAYGEWAVTAVLASHIGADWIGTGRLRLSPPTPEFIAQHSDRNRLRKDRLLIGWLYGDSLIHRLGHPAFDSMEVSAVFERDGSLTIGQGFWTLDGGGFEGWVESAGTMRGTWHPSGSVTPPFMGWFCASRIPPAPRRGDEGPYTYP